MAIVSVIINAIKFATAYIFGATGEIVSQKGGHLNMGIPGIMYLGALGGILGERIYVLSVSGDSLNPFLIVFIPMIFAILFSAIGGALFSFFTVTLHCNQNVTGLTLTTFGTGFSCYFIGVMAKDYAANEKIAKAGLQIQNMIPESNNWNWFARLFLSHSAFTYIAIILAIVALLVLNKTRVGLNLRAVGENPASADAAGINVDAYRYLATIIGSAIAGLGGLAYEMDFIKGMYNIADAVDSVGWLALCLVIFSFWNPAVTLGTSFLFGVLNILPSAIPVLFKGITITGEWAIAMKAIPYIITILILILSSIFKKHGGLGPQGLGQSYFREDR